MNESFIRSLMYNPEKHGINILQVLTAMFVHADYRHMLKNLSSTISLGYSVHKEFGQFFMNSTFLIGGVISSISPDEVTKFIASGLIEPEKKSLDWKSIASFTTRQVFHCGSSGGVFALLGCNFVIVGKKIFESVEEFKRFQRQQRSVQSVSLANQTNQETRLWIKIHQSLLSLFSMTLCVLNEYASAKAQSSILRSNVLVPRALIGHDTHLKGFFVGASITAGCLYFRYRLVNSIRSNRFRRN